jgi:hypothetical protein
MKAGSLGKKATKLFVDASYNDVNKIGKFEIDPELSTKRSKVYVNPSGKVVVAHQGSKTVSDWTKYNPSILLGKYKNTKRYKDIEDLQKEVNAKYGKSNVQTVTHSQTGVASRLLAKKGLTESGQSGTLNPAILGRKPKGLKVYRSSGDIVSAFTKLDPGDVTIQAKTYNPVTEHGTSVLEGGSQFDLEPKRYL